MSSFDGRAQIFLFDLTTGKKKLAYGRTVEDAMEILSMRLTPEEMEQLLPERYRIVRQSELRSLIHLLG